MVLLGPFNFTIVNTKKRPTTTHSASYGSGSCPPLWLLSFLTSCAGYSDNIFRGYIAPQDPPGGIFKVFSRFQQILLMFLFLRALYSFSPEFLSNLKSNLYSPRTCSVILQSQIRSSFFGHLNNPPWRSII